MSCLAPISIPDKILRKFGVSDNHLLVPCGHCAGCAKDRRNDWFVRLWSLYHEARKRHEPVWFITATINPRLWPNMTIDSPDVGDRIVPFVRSWNERFRYLNGGKMPLRFVCSEFGSKDRDYIDKKGITRVTTGALHFHGLLFGYIDVSSVQRGLRKTHGYVDFDLIRGPEAIRYTVKYCTKDYSIEDPRLRARTFCSPGIGDSKFYFGDSEPTRIVLINGFHYRTPRYLIDKQWLSIYGKDRFRDSIGSSILVDANCRRRIDEINASYCSLLAERDVDSSLRDYLRYCRERDAKRPATLEQVLLLYDQRMTGVSHPLLRYYMKRVADIDSRNIMFADHSFDFAQFSQLPIFNQLNFYSYEGHQTVVPLSFDFET